MSDSISSTSTDITPSPEQRRGMRDAILTQTAGVLTEQVFFNGIMLVYLINLNVAESRVPFYLAIPFGLSLFTCVAAHQADRRPKKRIGIPGALGALIGFVFIFAASFFRHPGGEVVVVGGIIIYGFGTMLFLSCWFALMNPVVPPGMRGRFWGKLRLSWQGLSIVLTLLSSFFLTEDSPMIAYQIILGVVIVGAGLRVFFYSKIPDLEPPRTQSDRFLTSFGGIFKIPDFFPFSSYYFLLMLIMGAGPTLFGMVEKEFLGLASGTVVLLGAVTMAGCVVGFWIGGAAIDRFGTKPAFLICHFGVCLTLLAYVTRAFMPVPELLALGAPHFFFGAFYAVSSVAATTEMFALLPKESQSLSTAFFSTMTYFGRFLSGALVSAALGLRFLRKTWRFLDADLSSYDAIMLILATLAVVFVVTLGLVPSIAGRKFDAR